MMSLQAMKKAVDSLSPQERRELREYLEQRESVEAPAHELSPEDRIRHLDAAAKAIREGMTQVELDDMIEAMNAEYVEIVDEDEWTD